MVSVPSATANAAASSTSSASASLSGTFDTFLKLLTTQLQNQDPLSPMDSAKFTEQLVQYSQVEQQISTNSKLDSLASKMSTSSSIGALSYLGRTATFNSNVAALTDDGAKWQYALGDAARTVTISVLNADGDVVYTQDGERGAGAHTFSWDGDKSGGGTATNGLYSLRITAKAADDAKIETAIAVDERITGVDFSGEDPKVSTAAGPRALSTILRIAETAS
jgi:flagellar basal-body rod modification protein FlgD